MGSRPLLSFSILSCLQTQEQQQQQETRQQQQETRQQQQETRQQQQETRQPAEKKKIRIKPKVVVVDTTTKTEEKKQGEKCYSEVPTTPIRKKIIIIKKQKQDFQKCFSYNDIVPPASMIYTSQNNFYYTPPPPQRCCRFFIENKHCFLRESDNTCISPTSRTVIGFWNGGVGKECKLLPIQDETTYEQEIVDEQTSPPSSPPTVALSPPTVALSPPTVALSQPLSPQPSPNTTPLKSKSQKSKPRFVSDAQRARIASEPVALLREKLAKQYGMRK